MNINRNNYEVWFLDYLEGNLEESLIDDFLLFLQENPDLAEELRSYEPVGLKESCPEFPGRNRLYKQPFDFPDHFESTAVGMMEGDLDEETRSAFLQYLNKYPDKNRDLELFRQTRLIPDDKIVFPGRNTLYRNHRVLGLQPSFLLRIAALLFIFWTTSVILEQTGNQIRNTQLLPLIVSESKPSAAENNVQENSLLTSVTSKMKEEAKSQLLTGNDEKAEVSRIESPGEPAAKYEMALDSRMDQPSLLPQDHSNYPVVLHTVTPGLIISAPVFEQLAENSTEERFLSDKLADRIGLTRLSMGKIVRWGLSLASGISKGKFNYATGESGDIIALSLDTRLLGFSIPVNEK